MKENPLSSKMAKWLKTVRQVWLHLTPFVLALTLVDFSLSTPSNAHDISSVDACILEVVESSSNSMTIGEAKVQCTPDDMDVPGKSASIELDKTGGVIQDRLNVDDSNILKPFTLMTHNANYILLGAYNFQGLDTGDFEKTYDPELIDLDNTEVQFQISFKIPLAVDIFEQKVDIFAAYSVRSFWQLYNSDNSSPFRETNHEPEVWMQLTSQWHFFGFKNSANILGFSHQSNGQGGYLSRSWNRVYMGLGFEQGNFAFFVKPWIHVEVDFEDDNNSDITDYLGHGEIQVAYKYAKHTFSLMSRNNFESGFSKGAVQLGWSFPLFQYDYFKGYIQYFSGYGESLIYYDKYVNRIGVGLLLTEFM